MRVFARKAGAPPPKRLRLAARSPASARYRHAAAEARGAPPPPPALTPGVKNGTHSSAVRAACRQPCVSSTRAPARETSRVGAAARRGAGRAEGGGAAACPDVLPVAARVCKNISDTCKSAPLRRLPSAAAATPGAQPAMVP